MILKNYKKSLTTSIALRFLNVITGFIPVILVQQITNLVNKFALLFKRSLLNQDCRNASGNDWCWRCWLNTCCKFFNASTLNVILRRERSELSGESRNRMAILLNAANSISSRFLNVITGFIPVILVQQVTNLVKKTGFLSDVYKRGTRARKFLADGVQGGRSMIEMLGVLAIIAVLSVGGIAGYSKAMEKYKLNKVTEQYSYLFQGLIEHGDSLRLSGPEDKFLTNIVAALNLVPTSWTLNSDNLSFIDDYGNNVGIITRNKEFVFNLGFRNAELTTKTCEAFFQNVFQPLHAYMTRIHFYDMKGVNQQYMYYGDTMCSNGRLCLRDMTVSDIHKACGYCSIKEGSACFVVIYF